MVLSFIRVDSVRESIRGVAMRASQGGHDVPDEKLIARFERTNANLQRAIERLPHVLVDDNSNLEEPFGWLRSTSTGSELAINEKFR